MSDKATAQSGRLLWVEPNKMDSVTDTGTFDYEDYSICVDLEVRIPKRSACGTEDEVITFHTNHETAKDRTSFFTGTDGFLTTSFTDITANDPTSNKETLGISSIDITYNSYFYPQVTVKFVDVRGSSLMYPQEDMFKNGSQGSFFKALFCFPYPQFILKVKGFYGKQVQYDLAVEDFKTSFNPDTGNFECIVKFIGYMYGIYADLPMSYLIVAPYVDYAGASGSKYWKEQVEKGIFVYENGEPIKKLWVLNTIVKTAESSISTVMQNDEDAQIKAKLMSEEEALNTIDTNLSGLLNKIQQETKSHLLISEKNIVFCNDSAFNINDICINEWMGLNENISNYNSIYDESHIPYIAGNNQSEISGTTLDTIYKNFKSLNLSKLSNGGINVFCKNNIDEFIEQIDDNDIISRIPQFNKDSKIYYYRFKTNDIVKTIENRKKVVKETIDSLTKKINGAVQQKFLSVLGFKPTLNNIFRTIFAHIDTFMHLYYGLLKEIIDEKKNGTRKPITYQLTDLNSDLIRCEDFVPPFPLVTKRDGTNGNVTIWPADHTPAATMKELDFVESFFRTIKAMRQDLDSYSTTSFPEGSNGPVPFAIPRGEYAQYNVENTISNMVPCTLSDLHYFKNPYEVFKMDKDLLNVNSLFTTLAYRIKDIGLDGDNSYLERTRGCIEAINFFKCVPKLNTTKADGEASVCNLIRSNEVDKDAENFYKFIIGEQQGTFKDDFTKQEGPILTNPYYPIGFTDVRNPEREKINHDENLRFEIIPISDQNVGFFWEVFRKTEKEITDDGLLGSYRDFWDYNYEVNDVYDIDDYSEEKGLEHFKDGVYKTLILGSRSKHFYRGHDSDYYVTHGLYTKQDFKDEYINFTVIGGRNGGYMEHIDVRGGVLNMDSYDAVKTYFENKEVGPVYVLNPSRMKNSTLYGSYIFYMQNDIDKNEKIEYKNKEYSRRDIAKAYIFLEMCAPSINIDISKISILTKWTILLYGARLLRKELSDELLYVTNESGYVLPEKGQPMCIYDMTTLGNQYYQGGIASKSADYLTMDEDDYVINKFTNVEKDKLINDFLEWAIGDSTSQKTFQSINNILELKLKDGSTFNSESFKELIDILDMIEGTNESSSKLLSKNDLKKYSRILSDNDIDKLFGTLNSKTISKSDILKHCLSKDTQQVYSCGYVICNNQKKGIYILLNTGHPISQSLMKYKFDVQIFSPICIHNASNKIVFKTNGYDIKLTKDQIKKIYKEFIIELNKKYTANDAFLNANDIVNDNIQENINSSLSLQLTKSKDLKLSLYLTLKNLYDRWLCGLKRDRWKFINYKDKSLDIDKTCEFNNFYFLDSFYNDVGDKIILDIGTMSEILKSVITNRIGDETYTPNGMKFQGISVYQFMATILQKNSMNFLAVPCFNIFKTQEDIKELFTPFSWYDRGEPRVTSYIGIYPHRPSSNLNIEGANGYQYPNDGFDIADVNGDFKDTLDIPDLSIIENGYVMPAFGVTYAKQDQSYFKKVTVNMDNPQVTEYSIGATLDIANTYGENQKVQTFVGQDLYKVYSNYSYTCTVEMMGNAMITPLMYFQLNNIPMFRGAYMIIKVEHNIVQGNMTTTFTGVRMSKNKIPFVNAILEVEGLNDDSFNSGGQGSLGYNTTITEDTSIDKKELINKFVAVAVEAVSKGIKEEPIGSNIVPEIPELPIQGKDPGLKWCAIFVGWCAEKSGLNPDIIGGPGGDYKGVNWTHTYQSNCNGYYTYYNNINRIIQQTNENKVNNPPQKGDLILFKKSGEYESNNTYSHIGIVEGYNAENGIVTYIHGNSDNMVKRTEKSYDAEDIGCFVRPPYGCKVSNVKTTVQPTTSNTQTETIDGDDIIISSAEDKIRLINAMIWRECGHNDGLIGDRTTKYPAYGILQIRHYMLEDVTRIVKENPTLQGTRLGNLSSLTPETNIDKDLQVQELIAVFEWYNKGKSTYINDTSKTKDASQIPWSMKFCCAKWNGAVIGKPREPAAPKYFKAVKEKYNEYKTKPIPTGNLGSWTPNKAFNEFFS